MNWKQKLTSRKFWMAVVGAFITIANDGLGLKVPGDVILPFALLIITYILGESIVDAARQIASAKTQGL